MAYIEPKTNWIASNIPVASDFNRIEGNTKQNHDDIAAEAIARAADVDAEEAARIADVNAEESARIAADLLKAPIPKQGSGAGRFVVLAATYNGFYWLVTFPEAGTWLVLNDASITAHATSFIGVSGSGSYMCWRLA